MTFKLKLYRHTSIVAQIDDDIPKVIQYFADHNITLQIDQEPTIIPKQDVLLKLFISQIGKYDACMYMYDPTAFIMQSFGLTFNVSSTLRGIYLACDVVDDSVGFTWKSFCHEVLHAITYRLMAENNLSLINFLDSPIIDGVIKPYFGNDDPNLPNGNFAQQWNAINPYLNKSTYKYFQPSEIVGLKPELVSLLDQARGIAGVPFKITSGLRSPSQNALVGGVQDSAHETGLAVDLAVADGVSGGKILQALQKVGLDRFGFYTDGHLHTDYDLSKPHPCYWVTVK